jgi:hypothetical protein
MAVAARLPSWAFYLSLCCISIATWLWARLVSHVIAAPLVIPQVVFLGGDTILDAYKGAVYQNGEALNDEGTEGYIFPSFVRQQTWLPEWRLWKTYLPGWREDGGFDIEW